MAACAREDGTAAVALRDSLEATRASLAALQPPGGAAPVTTRAPAAAQPVATVAAPLAFEPGPPRRRTPGSGAPPAEAAALHGLVEATVTRWIGEPALRRPEGDAEIWLYLARACALDLVLYRDAPGGALRVAHAAARASGAERQGEAACLAEIAGGEAPRVTTGPPGGGA